MQLISLITLAVACASAAPSAAPRLKPWNVTTFEFYPYNGSDGADIHIIGPAQNGMPAFDAGCFTLDRIRHYRKCRAITPASDATISMRFAYAPEDVNADGSPCSRGCNPDGDVTIYFKYEASGKTLLGNRTVRIPRDYYTSEHFKVHPFVP